MLSGVEASLFSAYRYEHRRILRFLDFAQHDKPLVKICDLTQFYSPVSGGVKRYLHEKIGYIERHARRDKHVLIVPGAKTNLKANGRSRVYTIRSPLVSRSA